MKRPLFVITALLLGVQPAAAQTFSSGSTGLEGPYVAQFVDQTIVVKEGGVYHHTTYTIAAQRLVRYQRGDDNSPVVILATGDVTIDGTITANGADGLAGGNTAIRPSVPGGPGGFTSGRGGLNTAVPPVLPAAGQGPGGGLTTGSAGNSGSYGAPDAFVSLVPLFGGSGGAGGSSIGNQGSGSSGGGGGGAILIASSTRIIVNGTITANGGNAGTAGNPPACAAWAGAGSGGAIRLVAPIIQGPGIVRALRGTLSGGCPGSQPTDGRIRLEAFNMAAFTGLTQPVASRTTAPGPTFPSGNPALSNVPTLQIATIANQPVPAVPAASYSVPDLTLPLGTGTSIEVVINATNTPVGAPTVISVRVMPVGPATTVDVASANHTGSFASSTATVDVTLPSGQVSVLQAHASMNLTGQSASLFPLIDGEPVERVAMAATPGQASTLSLVTKSGREVPVEKLSDDDRQRVALAWEVMKHLRAE